MARPSCVVEPDATSTPLQVTISQTSETNAISYHRSAQGLSASLVPAFSGKVEHLNFYSGRRCSLARNFFQSCQTFEQNSCGRATRTTATSQFAILILRRAER